VSYIARAIQDQLLKDFASKSEFSDWFAREEVERPPPIVKPNPRNLEHDEKIAELEARLQRYVLHASNLPRTAADNFTTG